MDKPQYCPHCNENEYVIEKIWDQRNERYYYHCRGCGMPFDA